MSKIFLVTGGARSGKSSFALSLALRNYTKRAFVATAVPMDQEMKQRISRHREERGDQFHTIEEPLELPLALSSLPAGTEAAVVDCLTVWLGVDRFIAYLDHPACDLILVTNEVGMGIVPENPLARAFRDMAGYLNRCVAQKAAGAYLLCCGMPLTLKGESLRG